MMREAFFFCLLLSIFSHGDCFNSISAATFDVGSFTQNTQEAKLQKKQDKLESHLNGVNTSLAMLIDKVKAIEDTKLQSLGSAQDLQTGLDSVKRGQEKVNSMVEHLSAKYEEIENKTSEVTAMKKAMESFQSAQTKVTDDISSLSHSVTQVSQGLKQEMEKKNKVLKESISALSSKNTLLEAKLANVEKKLDGTKAQTGSKTTDAIVTAGKRHGSTGKSERKMPTTCADVQQCGKVKEDGEYWLYPKVLGGKRVKVFCSGMDTDAEEYVSLPQLNEGDYPGVHNPSCRSETRTRFPKKKLIGHVNFNKIRVNITTMEVTRSNTEYAVVDGAPIAYGQARDCYTVLSRCGPKGYFNINTRGTGLRVNTKVTWVKNGYGGKASYKRTKGGQVISVKCGGYCGGCTVEGHFTLELYPADVVPETSAKEVICS